MMRVRRGWAWFLALLALSVIWSTAAGAAQPSDTGQQAVIDSVIPQGDDLELQVRALNLPSGEDLGADDVEVRIDGHPVVPRVVRGEQQRDSVTRRVALVLDTSGSMAGSRIDAARTAAATYLELVPADVEVGLVAFAATPQLLVAPTRDRAAVAAVLPGLVPNGDTALYDALLLAQESLGPEGERRIVVLSDGEDSASTASFGDVLAAVDQPELAVDAVVLGDQPAATAVLERLTASGQGYLLQALQSLDAEEAFASAATAFSSGFVARVPVPEDLAGESVTIRLYAHTPKGLATAQVQHVLPGEPPADVLSSVPVFVLGLTATFTGLLGLLVLAVRSGDSAASGRRRTEDVLRSYSLVHATSPAVEAAPVSRVGDSAAARGLLGMATSLLRGRGLEDRLALRLDRADVRFTPSEWVVVHLVLSLITFLCVTLLSGPAAGVLAGLLAGLALHLVVGVRGSRRQRAFTEAMPDALQLLAGGLATGYSLPQALDSVVREGLEPLASEFGRALAEARVGVPLDVALDKVADRMESEDFRWVVMAIRVQRDVGGNLSEVLTTITTTMRDRAALHRQVRALSAEGRLGALILTALPILVTLYLATFSREFFSPMLETTIGHLLLAGCAISLAIGGVWLKKLARVEM